MNLLNKLKQGVSKAETVAKNTVEANKLKGSIQKNQNTIRRLYQEIGEKVFTSVSNGQSDVNSLVAEQVNQIQELLDANVQLEKEIKAVWNQKDCVCGKSVDMDAKFCSTCGHQFPAIEHAAPMQGIQADSGAADAELSNAAAEEEAESNFSGMCPNCDADIEKDMRFCGECGTSL